MAADMLDSIGDVPVDPNMPDLSHLSEEERAIIEQVLQRQRAEEQKEEEILQRADKELEEIERQIAQRKETAQRLIGTQDDAICQICHKTKFADGIGHKCFYCQLRSCARCGGKTTSKNKNIWACSMCQKRQQILARTGKWFQNPGAANADASPTSNQINDLSPSNSEQNFKEMQNVNSKQQRKSIEIPFSQFSNQFTRRKSGDSQTSAQSRTQSFKRQTSLHKQASTDELFNPYNNNTIISNKTVDSRPINNTSDIFKKQASFISNSKKNQDKTLETENKFYNQDNQNNIPQYQQQQFNTSKLKDNEKEEKKNLQIKENVTTTYNQVNEKPKVEADNIPIDKKPLYIYQQPSTSFNQKQNNDYKPQQTLPNKPDLHLNQKLKSGVQSSYKNENLREGRRHQGFEANMNNNNTINNKNNISNYNNYKNNNSSNKLNNNNNNNLSNNNTNNNNHNNNNNNNNYFNNNNQNNNSNINNNNNNNINNYTLANPKHKSLTSSVQSNSFCLNLNGTNNNSQDHLQGTAKSSKRIKLPRQLRSLSSSEEEVLQNQGSHNNKHFLNEKHSLQILPLDTSLQKSSGYKHNDFSEKDLLRYIYGPEKFSNNHKSASFLQFNSKNNNKNHCQLNSSDRMLIPRVSAGKVLASKIRNYLSQPVSWQPSTDQRRLIGHMVLKKSSHQNHIAGDDFGIKVIGGKLTSSGGMGTYITQVKPGSIADVVGQLKPGDEVLEWNSHCMENLTHDSVCKIVEASRNSQNLELIVSRSANVPGNDDFLNFQQMCNDSTILSLNAANNYDLLNYYTNPNHNFDLNANYGQLPHSQSLINSYNTPLNNGFNAQFEPNLIQQKQLHNYVGTTVGTMRAASPLVFHLDAMPLQQPLINQVCGKVEISLLYVLQKCELFVTLYRGYDFLPRQNGLARNSYVKLFLLPDRSEKSCRQSAAIADTLTPVWNETFYYSNLNKAALMSKVLEVTVWDYDKYETNTFLGETLIDLSQATLNNRPLIYVLLDMNEENPLRLQLRQRRYSSQTPPYRSRSQTSHYSCAGLMNLPDIYEKGNNCEALDYSSSLQNLLLNPNKENKFLSMRHPKNLKAKRNESYFINTNEDVDFDIANNIAYGNDWNQNSDHAQFGTLTGYLSDIGSSESFRVFRDRRFNDNCHLHKRPRSATALRNLVDIENATPTNLYSEMSTVPLNQPMYENQRYHQNQIPNRRQKTRQQEILQNEHLTGYGSDVSDGTLSVNSALSMRNRLKTQQSLDENKLNHSNKYKNTVPHQLHRNYINLSQDEFSNRDLIDENLENSINSINENESLNDCNSGLPIMASGKGAAMLLSKRKKSLMTRFIPGRNGISEGKRMGFARSEEIGVSEALSIPDNNSALTFKKQTSKESTDSSENFLPLTTDKPLGNFVENLGPGQVVGRQCLGSAVLGELQLGLSYNVNQGIILEVIKAKNLVLKHGSKTIPASYVKAYLMEDKSCIAKAKTQPAKKTTSPVFQQRLVFASTPRGKMLQLSVLGDYGRMERKTFMGILQINLNELNLELQEPIIGWYKLFHSNSIAGSSTTSGGIGMVNNFQYGTGVSSGNS